VIEPIFLAEAAVNGLLLGGVLALLALGLNLIFGVIDIVWIAYVDLVMICMYAVYFIVQVYGYPIWLGGLASVALGALLGISVHLLIISPILTSAPVNQLLATGGLLYFLQSFATLLFTTDFRNIGVRLPIIEIGGVYISYSRLLAFVVALVGATALYLFLKRTYIGTAIRAIAQDREIIGLMGVDQRRIYLVTSAIGGALAGLGACLLAPRTCTIERRGDPALDDDDVKREQREEPQRRDHREPVFVAARLCPSVHPRPATAGFLPARTLRRSTRTTFNPPFAIAPSLDFPALDHLESPLRDRVHRVAHVAEPLVVRLAADVANVDLLQDHAEAEHVEDDVPVQVGEVGAGLARVAFRRLTAGEEPLVPRRHAAVQSVRAVALLLKGLTDLTVPYSRSCWRSSVMISDRP